MKLRNTFLIALFINSALFCFANGETDQRSQGRPERPDEQMPMPSESELTVLRLQTLAEFGFDSVVLDEDQATALIPILEEWQAVLEDNPDSDGSEFIERIASELTDEQNNILPPPPGSMASNTQESDSRGGGPQGGGQRSGGPQGGGGQGGQGGPPMGERPTDAGSEPEEIVLTELIPEVIELLKEV